MLTRKYFRHWNPPRVIKNQWPIEPQTSSSDNDSLKPNFDQDTESQSSETWTRVSRSSHGSQSCSNENDSLKSYFGQETGSRSSGAWILVSRFPHESEELVVGNLAQPSSAAAGGGRNTNCEFLEPSSNAGSKPSRPRANDQESKFEGLPWDGQILVSEARWSKTPFTCTAMVPVGSNSSQVQLLAQSASNGRRTIYNARDNAPGDAQQCQTKEAPSACPLSSDANHELKPDIESTLFLQPIIKPVSHEKLRYELGQIYTGLEMAESKCVEVDEELGPPHQLKLNNEQWQLLIQLHETLLEEHLYFLQALQHPSASPASNDFSQTIQSRMWRHGIWTFLERLQEGLPESHEHMLTFLYIAYRLMALFYETVPRFRDTWMDYLECLSLYFVSVKADDVEDREHWATVVRYWYDKRTLPEP